MKQLASSLGINVYEQQDVVAILQSFLNILVSYNIIDNDLLKVTLEQKIELSYGIAVSWI